MVSLFVLLKTYNNKYQSKNLHLLNHRWRVRGEGDFISINEAFSHTEAVVFEEYPRSISTKGTVITMNV